MQLETPINGCIAKLKVLDLAELQRGALDTSLRTQMLSVYFVSSFPRENQGKEDTKWRCCQPFLSPCNGAHWVLGGKFRLQEKLGYITLLCLQLRFWNYQRKGLGTTAKQKKISFQEKVYGWGGNPQDPPVESNHLGLQLDLATPPDWEVRKTVRHMPETCELSHPGPNSPGTVKIPPKDCSEESLDFHCGVTVALRAPALVIRH